MSTARMWGALGPLVFLLTLESCGASHGTDAGAPDGGFDSGLDAGLADGGPSDSGPSDSGSSDSGPPDGAPAADAGPVDGGAPFVCPQDGIRGSGRHRLFVQGATAPPLPDGTWPFLHEWQADGSDAVLCDDSIFVIDTNMNGMWDPGEEPHPMGPSAIVHGEHFLVGVGAFVEFTATLCEDITGNVTFYIPNFDRTGSVAAHQLYVVHDGVEFLIAEVIDDEPGFSGYNPFVRVVAGNDPDLVPGDTLLMRSINVSGEQFSVMVWYPPSEYESWILVEVP